jgi:hypothetical protein
MSFKGDAQMKHGKTLSVFVYLAWFVGLSIFIGCGDPEDTESADSIVIPSELYDTSQLTYDISDAEVQELMALDVPTNWSQTEDPELRARYYHAQLLQQFGNIPAVHIVAERKRKQLVASGVYSATLDEQIEFAKAQYVLWPNESNRKYLERFLKDKLMQETDDPKLFAKIFREQLIKQFGDIPEVDIVVEGEKKFKFGGFRLPDDADEYLAYHEALHVLFPNESVLHQLERAREEVQKLKAEG